MFNELIPLLKEIIETMSETVVTIKHPTNSYSTLARADVKWETKALFDYNGTVIRNGQYTRGMVLLVPKVPEFTPEEGDHVTFGSTTVTIVGVKPIGVDGNALGYELDVGQ